MGKQTARLKGLTSINRFFFLCPPNHAILITFIECRKNQISVVCDTCHSHNYHCDKVPPYSNTLYEISNANSRQAYDGLFLTSLFQHVRSQNANSRQADDGLFLTSLFIKAETALGLTRILSILYTKDYYTSLL